MIGRTVSHYRILSQVGSGGMGVVYEAEDMRLGRHVALKLLPSDGGRDSEAMDRFLREARIVSTLNHPHVCTLHDIGEHDGQQFMVMELLEGESMKERIARGPLSAADVLEFGVQIADALDVAHTAGVIHRDIKPANLFITRRGQAKVLDFGVAKLADAGGDRSDLDHTRAVSDKTTAGSTLGTVAYMSPEQARGHEIDARSDLFSFGDVLYEMATGKPPFSGPTPAVVFEGILTKEPAPPSRLNADLPPELDRIIAKALEKDRETRYQSASDLRADLKRLKRDTESSHSVTAAIPGAAAGAAAFEGPRFRRGIARAVLIAAALVAIAAIGGFMLWRSQQTPALTMRDTVVLADFRNRTGDTMFDGTLSEALAVQLRQSPFLNLLSEPQVEMTLRQMGREPMAPVTSDVAREICVRTAAKATLGGTIGMVGNRYLLTLSAQDCVNGNVIAEEAVEANGKDEVLAALGGAAAEFRSKLGESLTSVQRYDQRIEQATTKSLEALKAYSQGVVTRRVKGDEASLPFFRRAVEIDPEFALAQARLGTVLNNVGQRADAEEATRRAYALRDKVSERERWYIEARHFTLIEKNNQKASDTYRVLVTTYPDDWAGHHNLGTTLRGLGRLKDAIASLEEAARLNPAEPLTRRILASAYLDDGRLDDSRRAYEESLKLLDAPATRFGLVALGAISGDQSLVDQHLPAIKDPGTQLDAMMIRAQAAAFRGRMKESARLGMEIFTRVKEDNRLQAASARLLGLAIGQILAGHTDEGRRIADVLRATGKLDDETADELIAIAGLLGDKALMDSYGERARKQLKSANSSESALKAERALSALLALGRGRYQEAYDLAIANGTDVAQQKTLLVAGIAALRLQRWDDAVRIFKTLLDFGIGLGLNPQPAFVRIQLARAQAGAGRTADARQAYEDAFKFWEDADPDVPILLEARREYDRLTS